MGCDPRQRRGATYQGTNLDHAILGKEKLLPAKIPIRPLCEYSRRRRELNGKALNSKMGLPRENGGIRNDHF